MSSALQWINRAGAWGVKYGKVLFASRFLPVIGTLATLVIMLIFGQIRYSGRMGYSFVSLPVLTALLQNNAYLIVLAIGMTFVILSGGIDLSVGAVVALTTVVIARLLPVGVPLGITLIIAVLVGTAMGLLIGVMVQSFGIQPFIASLAVLFLARGLSNVIGVDENGVVRSLAIVHEGFAKLASWSIKFGEGRAIWRINASVLIAIAVLIIAYLVLHHTRFGRTVYGIGQGDNGMAAGLMGLNPERSKIAIYMISGTCAGIAGVLFALFMQTGFCQHGIGMELDAIAAVVIGGTLLAGGSGFVLGSAAGVLVYGLIFVFIPREGLDATWSRIFMGVILLLFVLLQRAITVRGEKRSAGHGAKKPQLASKKASIDEGHRDNRTEVNDE
ncbi:MAG: sugar ABC transporter permease YjfF [Propionibacteriaceae bacterium]|nr:sugar ABC transporter permease YjfF [Propionibacteriaceae bacterium]